MCSLLATDLTHFSWSVNPSEGIICSKGGLYGGKMHSDSTASPIGRKVLVKSNMQIQQ